MQAKGLGSEAIVRATLSINGYDSVGRNSIGSE